ncbi:DNA topoisomerase III [Brevibacillus brevis]|uniref:DNA topoisomerase n=1 Tax=Brevibacillus brevis TaxID=1393 RepID=A0ABY9SY78_BREBE|nr:DNA topoisomerase III [Brevibacillus brevis]WNC12787.1 DNA topoisomerase III [Brevibacillus brevis]
MKVVIAEKPDQAMKLASPFPHKKQQGYLEVRPNRLFPNGAFFTWAVGHICELVPPEAYNPAWKKWSLQTLPLIPPTFRHQVMRSKAKQFGIIKQLLRRSDVKEIIHAGDAGREGELIIRTIVEQSGVHKPMKRLWISSLTEKAVTAGFESLLDEAETRNLYYEAYSRSCADWLVGMNASRVYTLLLKQKGISDVFSAGRVQTPTLALVVKREKEIAAFKPEPFWEVKATFEVDKKRYEGVWHKDGESRLNDPAMAEKIAAFCKDKPAQVHQVETERKEFLPPYLFNLSSLQATANKMFKFSPQKTLEIAQKLYVKGLLSYPRSDSSFVTPEEAKTFPEILAKLSRQPDYQAYFPTPKASISQDRRYVNQKKVTDHYAIIPTEQVPNIAKLEESERKIYDLVARRLIAAHGESALFDYTTVTTLVDGRAVFLSKGKVQIRAGWRDVLFDEDKDDKESILPPLSEGDTGKVRKVEAKESKTQPPKRYTEGQLITLMKTAGKHLDNQELEKVLMKTEGLGTEATRAGIIGMLKDRKYIEVRKNQVFATQKGMLLIDVIGDKILASPEMTARWEQRLGEIGQGEASAQAFMEQVRKLSQKIVEDAVEQSREWKLESYDVDSMPKQKSKFTLGAKVAVCKACGGDLVDKGDFYGCSNYKKGQCSVTVSKTILGKKISAAMVKKVMETGKSNLIKGFQKGKEKFDAYLVWEEQEKKAKVHRD